MPSAGDIRVLCVDDNPDLSLLLHKQLDLQEGMQSVGRVHDLSKLLDTVTGTRPDVVVLDFSMLGRETLTTMGEVQAAHPQVRILIYTGYGDSQTVERARQAGAWGYAVKCEDIDDLVEAIHRVAGGERVFPPSQPHLKS